VTSIFLSTSTHYPGTILRNQLVPWNLHASMEGFLYFDSGFSLSTPNQKISPSVRLQLKNSHMLDCTSVPWESLTLMVISLTLVNGIH
jgi:hypothetical protein